MSDYGNDIDCGSDLDPSMREVSGWWMLAQAMLRRLITPRGSLIYDQDYGYDLRSFIGSAETPTAGAIENELLKDGRLRSVEVSVAVAGDAVEVRVNATAYEVGEFALTLSIGEVTADVLPEAA